VTCPQVDTLSLRIGPPTSPVAASEQPRSAARGFTAEAVGEVIGAVFPPLPLTLLSPLNGLANRHNDPQAVDIVVEAPGIESAENAPFPSIPDDRGFETGAFSEPELELSPRTLVGRSEEAIGDRSASAQHSGTDLDLVERALAMAIERASAAGEWSAVATLAAELAARRSGPSTN
jgi:hypothetical protein